MTKKTTPYPKGKYPRTDEHRRKISEAAKGHAATGPKQHSEETKRKISESLRARSGAKAEDKPGGVVRPSFGTRACEVCREEFVLRDSREQKGRKYCSQQCAARRSEFHYTSDGYKMVRNPLGGWIREHRLVMEGMLGRPMTPEETVHHKNGARTDNRPENLELRGQYHGKGGTHHCPTCTCHLSEAVD